MLNEAIKAISESSLESSVYVGCDSIRFNKRNVWYIKYATVIVIHKDSNKGGKIFYETEVMRDYNDGKTPRQRLVMEAGYAAMAASAIKEVVGSRHMEIHLDLNPSPKHKSNAAVKEAIGYVLAQTGIEPKIKPQSWAAAHAADHMVKHGHGRRSKPARRKKAA